MRTMDVIFEFAYPSRFLLEITTGRGDCLMSETMRYRVGVGVNDGRKDL